MLPVMLEQVGLWTLIIVALSLAPLFPVLSADKSQIGGGLSGFDDPAALHAMKDSRIKFNHSLLNDGNRESTAGRGGKPTSADFMASFWNYNRMFNDAPGLESSARNRTSAKGSNSGRRSQRKKGSAKKETADTGRSAFWSEDIQIGCQGLRARRYISDGFCTSEEPIKEVACAGQCLPIMDMPWYAEFVKTIAKNKLRDWQCVEDIVRKKRVKLLCQDGKAKHYRIKVVESCKCKKITNNHNRTSQKKKKKKRKDKKSKQAMDHDRIGTVI